jgi:hypothetical protein
MSAKIYKCPIITAWEQSDVGKVDRGPRYAGECVNPGIPLDSMRHHLMQNNWSHEQIEEWEKREGIK